MSRKKDIHVKTFESNDIKQNKNFAALSYLSILFVIPLFLKKESGFAQFHARQGFILFLAESVNTLLIWFQPFHGLLVFLFIIVSAVGFLKALQGETWTIPLIGKYAYTVPFKSK